MLQYKIQDIMKMLPHKYPFLMIDSAYDIVPGQSGKGEKLFTIDEWFFQGHFPDNPIVPGVLLIESAAQLIAVVYQSVLLTMFDNSKAHTFPDEIKKHVGYLAKADVKFLSLVRPGDKVIHSIVFEKKVGRVSIVNVKSEADKRCVMQGNLFVSEQ